MSKMLYFNGELPCLRCGNLMFLEMPWPVGEPIYATCLSCQTPHYYGVHQAVKLTDEGVVKVDLLEEPEIPG